MLIVTAEVRKGVYMSGPTRLIAALAAMLGGVLLASCGAARSDIDTESGQDANEVVASAVADALATSWVADRVQADDHGLEFTSTITYQPPDPQSGRLYPAIQSTDFAVHGSQRLPGGRKVLLSDGSEYAECLVSHRAPCRPLHWMRVTSDRESVATGSYTGLGAVAPGSATSTEDAGVFDVVVAGLTGTDGHCPLRGCPSRLTIEDAQVRRLEVLVGRPEMVSITWDYGSFGDAPPVVVPPPDRIIESDPNSHAGVPDEEG
jgi:hypothetical protein